MAKTGTKTLLDLTNIFRRNKEAFDNPKVRYIINQGGSSSGKTWAIIQLLIFIAWTSKKKITIASESVPHLKAGAMAYFEMIMDELGYFTEDRYNRTDRIYKFPNGSTIHFKSGADPDKLKGYRTDILYVNEADEIPFESWNQFIIRTKVKAFIDFNPSKNECWVYDIQEEDNAVTIKSNYQDNTYLDQTIIDELNSKKNADPNWYRSFVLGVRPIGDDRVYNHFKSYKEIPKEEQLDLVFYGVDWGFNDPMVIVEVKRMKSGKHYVRELFYQSGFSSEDVLNKFKEMKLNKELNGTVYCDHKPEVREDLNRAGIVAKNAIKEINPGINTVRSTDIYVHEDSLNIWTEYKKYVWLKHRGKLTNNAIDKFNHTLDSIRYAIHSTKKIKKDIGYYQIHN